MFPSPNITLLYLGGGGLEAKVKPLKSQVGFLWAYKSPTHFMWTAIGVTEKLFVDNSLIVSSCNLI